jgi:hypothetical protein
VAGEPHEADAASPGRGRRLPSSQMHAALISLLSTAALAAAPPPATPSHTHRCTPARPAFTSLIATTQVRCREARALNAYMIHHETLSKGFWFGGETWRGTIYSRANDRTAMVYRHGADRVWITYGGAAS